MLFHDRQQLIVQQTVGCEQCRFLNRRSLAITGCDNSTSFFNQQLSCRKIPWRQLILKECTVQPRSHMRQVQRRRPESPHTVNLLPEAIADSGQSRFHHGSAIIRKADSKQYFIQVLLRTDMDWLAIVRRTVAPPSHIQIIANWLKHFVKQEQM